MEKSLSVNELLHDDITKVNYTLIPPSFHGDDQALRLTQDTLSRLINGIGKLSAVEQGLKNAITSIEKLRKKPDQLLYLLKDANAKGGNGEVIGMLRVGPKRLFLNDERDKMHEVDALCVLDFLILHHLQRRGMGRALFDHMLHDLEVRAEQLAVDGPSLKLEQFLRKNYGMERLLHQSNNFAIVPSFFDYNQDIRNSRSSSGRSTPSCTDHAAAPSYGRYAAHKPPCAVADILQWL